MKEEISGKIKIGFSLSVLLFLIIVFLGQGLATPVFKDYSSGDISPQNGTQYNPANLYNFTVNITDDVGGVGTVIENVTFQLGRPDGSFTNYTYNVTSNTCSPYNDTIRGNLCPYNSTDTEIWHINFTQSQIGSAGIYNFTWYAYNSTGVGNSSSTLVYNISKNQTNPVDLTIQNTTDTYSQNITVIYPSWTNITGYPIYQDSGNVFLFRNGTNRSTSSENVTLGAGTYEYKANITGNENYTANNTGSTYYIFVSKGTLDLSISGSDVTYPTKVDLNTSETNGGDSDVNYTLYRNDTGLVNFSSTLGEAPTGENKRISAGSYEYRINTTSGPFANWTTNTSGVTQVLTVSKGTQKLMLELNGSKSDKVYDKGTIANITVFSNISINNITANMTLKANFTGNNKSIPVSFSGLNVIQNLTDTGNLDLGNYLISANVSETENYTKAYNNSLILTVSDSTNPTILVYDYENATFKKSGDLLGLNISLSDNDEFSAFNVSVWVKNSTSSYVLAGKISNSTKADSKNEWANGSVSIPSNLPDGNNTLKLNLTDSSGNEGSNTSWVVQIDNTKPTLGSITYEPSSGIYEGNSITLNCDPTDSGSGVKQHSLTITKPDGSQAEISCGNTFTSTSLYGRYDVSYNAVDNVGNSNSLESSFTVYTRGGGGVSITPPSRSRTWEELTPEKYGKFVVDKPNWAVKQIKVLVKTPAKNIKITVTKQEEKPRSIEKKPTGKVYKYLKIESKNLKKENLEEGRIEFPVKKDWLFESNFQRDEIFLRRYSKGKWNRLKTSVTGEDSEFVYFEGITPEFSYFAISGEKVKEKVTTTTTIPKPTTTTTVPATTTTLKPTTTTLPKKKPKINWPVIGIIITIALILVFLLVRRKPKSKES